MRRAEQLHPTDPYGQACQISFSPSQVQAGHVTPPEAESGLELHWKPHGSAGAQGRAAAGSHLRG